MKKLFVLLAVAVAAFSPLVAHADLVGTSVNGTFNLSGSSTNLFDPANGFVPSGYGNTSGLPVTIGSGVEFAVGATPILYTFDFTGTTLTFTDTEGSPIGEGAFTATFTDSAFAGLDFSTVSNTISGLTAGLSGDVLTLTFAGAADGTAVNGSAVYSLTTPAPPTGVTPEPSTIALLGTGLLGVAGALRRRLF